MCTSDDSSRWLFNPLVECSIIPGLLRTPTDSSPPVTSYIYPAISSTASDTCSQCSPVPIRSCVDSPHKKSNSPKTTRLPDVFVGAIASVGLFFKQLCVVQVSCRALRNTKYSQQTDIHATGGIGTHNTSKRATADSWPRPRGHWDRQ
jgi:hypothetical protein